MQGQEMQLRFVASDPREKDVKKMSQKIREEQDMFE
jgi:hypothetical protein